MARGSRGARRARAAAAGLGLLLAGCSGGGGPVAGTTAPCPRIAILAEGADLTRFRPGAARDLTATTLDARITGFEARCDYAGRDRRTLEVRVTPRFEAERGPAAVGRTAELPWFAALSDAGDRAVLGRVADTARIAFPPNVQYAAAAGRTLQLAVPLGEGQRASDYVVRLAFQLSPEELALNRRRGPR